MNVIIAKQKFSGAHLFVKAPRPGDSEVAFGLRVKLPPATTSLGRGNPVKCLAQGHRKRVCPLISTLSL